jgi:hypothetical protein
VVQDLNGDGRGGRRQSLRGETLFEGGEALLMFLPDRSMSVPFRRSGRGSDFEGVRAKGGEKSILYRYGIDSCNTD